QEQFRAASAGRIGSKSRAERLEMRVDNDIGRQQRRFDFEITMLLEKSARERQQGRTLSKRFRRGRGCELERHGEQGASAPRVRTSKRTRSLGGLTPPARR